MEIQIVIPIQLYTIPEAAKKLKTSSAKKDFYKNHVDVPNGLRLTIINNKVRVSSIELERYIMNHTESFCIIKEKISCK